MSPLNRRNRGLRLRKKELLPKFTPKLCDSKAHYCPHADGEKLVLSQVRECQGPRVPGVKARGVENNHRTGGRLGGMGIKKGYMLWFQFWTGAQNLGEKVNTCVV